MLTKSLILSAACLATVECQTWWKPCPTTSWQIVLSAPLNSSYPSNITALDGDMFDTPTANWAALKAQGHKTICYFSAGTYEKWRPDHTQFNASDLGDALPHWPGEYWLNTSSPSVRKIMTDRMDLAVSKGCDAIDPDNMDAYDNGGGGFDLTQDDAVNYITFLASEAHSRGMACGLKNAGDIVSRVVELVDFSVNEQCVEDEECNKFQPYVDHGKPVFGIEYVDSGASQSKINDVCTSSYRPKTFETLVKNMDLGPWVFDCPVQSVCNGSSNATTNATVPSPSPSASPAPYTGTGNSCIAAGSFGLLLMGLFMSLI